MRKVSIFCCILLGRLIAQSKLEAVGFLLKLAFYQAYVVLIGISKYYHTFHKAHEKIVAVV